MCLENLDPAVSGEPGGFEEPQTSELLSTRIFHQLKESPTFMKTSLV